MSPALRRPALVVVMAALALAASGASSADAHRLAPLSLDGVPTGQVTGGFVEQQSSWLDCCTLDPDHTIANPDHSAYGTWDINEHNSVGAEGYLDGDATVTSPGAKIVWESDPIYSCRPLCAWWSGNSHEFGTYVLSSSPDLDIETCFQPQGRCFANGPPVYDPTRNHKGWVSRFCGAAVYDPADPALEPIPGSAVLPNTTDGIGVPSTVTVTVTNTASGKGSQAKDVSIYWGFSSDIWAEAGCSPTGRTANPPLHADQASYPFLWTN